MAEAPAAGAVQTYDELLSKGLAGPNILLNGESGTGKTYALGTAVEWAEKNGVDVFYFDIENSLETLLGYWRDPPPLGKGTDAPKNLHWHQLAVRPVSLAKMILAAKDTGELSYKLLTSKDDNDRGGQNNPFWQILVALNNFKDDRTGKEWGPVEKFGPDKLFILDSFTELSNAATKMVIGSRSTMAPPDYGVAQNHLMNYIRLACHGMTCSFIMTSHPARDKDEVTGSVRTTIKTVGTAIQPDIPPLFSDVLYSVREGNKFSWDTAAYGTVTKTRYLGYKAGITPDFGQIFDLWKKRGAR